jgi:hypothetical protein
MRRELRWASASLQLECLPHVYLTRCNPIHVPELSAMTKPLQVDSVARYERWGKWAAALKVAGYLLLLTFGGEARFASLGDAVGPLTGALTALALFAAIEGIRLQREELKLQRQELAKSREVMREQAEAARESAQLQKRLAAAQEALAKRQREANALSYYAHIATIKTALANLRAQRANANDGTRREVVEQMRPLEAHLLETPEKFSEQGGALLDGSHLDTVRDEAAGVTRPPPPGQHSRSSGGPRGVTS